MPAPSGFFCLTPPGAGQGNLCAQMRLTPGVGQLHLFFPFGKAGFLLRSQPVETVRAADPLLILVAEFVALGNR